MTFQTKLIKSFQLNVDRIAIEYAGRKISYAALFQDANKITAHLEALDLEKETIIGIDLSDKSALITSIIGVVNARCVFVLIDRSLPQERLDSMMEDLNLTYLISADSKPPFAHDFAHVWSYTELQQAPQELRTTRPAYDKEDSLYIYFTSGSTGNPKGIIGKNGSLLQFLMWEIEAFNLYQNKRVSQFISPFFDAFLRDIFSPLLAGGTICIPPSREDFFRPEELIPWIEESRINLIHCVPSLFSLINDPALSSGQFRDLTYVLMSGEKIIPASLKPWYEVFKDRIKLVNLYGLTETTMIRSFYVLSPEDVNRASIPIGSPIPDTEFLITKQDFKPCNTLVPGDLYIISDYVSKGYLNRRELTEQKFLNIPGYSAIAVKTGDRARKLLDGTIELLGRADRQVKLRGIRIELDEIESILAKHPAVQDQAVIVYKDKQELESLRAFITLKPEVKISSRFEKEILQYLQNYLPVYMIPARIEVLDKFPLLSNGKRDYKSLQEDLSVDKELILPASELEQQLLSIWKELLGDKPISTADLFYKIGGNSLSIIRLIGKINKEFKVKIKINELFNNSTIIQQAKLIQSKQGDNEIFMLKAPKKEYYALTSGQRRLYFLHEFDKNTLAFNLPQICKLEGSLDIQKLKKVLATLIDRHDSFRTYFELVEGEPKQKLAEHVTVEIELFQSKEEEVPAIIQKFVRPFDLSQASLFRMGLIKLSEEEQILMVDMHHIVSDGMSEKILLQDFMALYHETPLPDLTIQYKDYAEWIQGLEQQALIEKLKSFWMEVFSEKPKQLNLPSNFLRPSIKTYEGSISTLELNEKEVSFLKEVADREEVTVYMLLLAIFNVLISKLSRQADIVIGTPTAGRGHVDLQNLVGFFANTIALRYHAKESLSFRAFLKNVKTQTLAYFEHQNYPYEHLIDDLEIVRDPSRNPLFDIMFAYLNYEETELSIPGLTLKPYKGEDLLSKLDLSVFAINKGKKIQLNFEYSTQLFSQETIDVFIKGFKKIISVIFHDIDIHLAAIHIKVPDFTSAKKEPEKAVVAPANPLEQKLREMWAEIIPLPQNQIDVTQSFLEQGGSSASATEFVLEIGKVFGINLPIRTVFENPDIRSFSKSLMSFKRTPHTPIDATINDISTK